MNEARPNRLPTRQVPIRALVDVCTFVDELEPNAIGELVVSGNGSAQGAIFVEGGRVCWAAARGFARRLTELLVERAGGDARRMEGYYKQCQADGARWGEWLVGKGILSADGLRAALLEHTIESLRHLCVEGSVSTWCPRAVGGYAAQFTFTTAELLTRAGATSHRETARIVVDELAMSFLDGEWGAAFVRSRTSANPEPIALAGAHPASATVLLRAGKWASSTLDLATVLQHHEPVLSLDLVRDGGPSDARALVAFLHRGTIVVGETGAYGPARILHRRAKLRRLQG